MPKWKTPGARTVLGEGVSGIVYAERRNGARVAVKELRKSADESSLAAEAAYLFRLRGHPALPQPIAPEKTLPGRLVMPYAGVSLRAAAGRLPEDQAGRIVMLVVRAVAFCHSRGVFHADIKLSNVLYLADAESDISIIDFGNSVSEDELPFCSETTSPGFRAPWRAKQIGCVGHRKAMVNADYFSAALLFVALRTTLIERFDSTRDQFAYFEAGIGTFPAWYAEHRPDWFDNSGKVIGTCAEPKPFISWAKSDDVKTTLREMLAYDPWHGLPDTTALERQYRDTKLVAPLL